MGIGFMASYNCKRWAFPIQPSSVPKQSLRLSSALRGREASFESGTSNLYVTLEGGEAHRDAPKVYGCSSGALHNNESTSMYEESSEINDRELYGGSCTSRLIAMMDTSAYVASLRSSSNLQFSLLMENLDKIEDILAGSDVVRMERDIMVHIRKLGALKLFHACLSRTLMAPTEAHPDFLLTEHVRDCPIDSSVREQEAATIVCTGKSKQRKLKRRRASSKIEKVEDPKVSALTSLVRPKGSSRSRSMSLVARNESEMSMGVKEVADLEKTRLKLEEEIGHSASYAQWAEASGIDQMTLLQRLQFGWYCRDKLIKSTHSLVAYIAKNYRGMGIAFDDLLQAGNIGVLKGAERFDNRRGYRFSTYVQYWIRKSMLTLLARHSKAIQIPVTMERYIKKIQMARRTFYDGEGRYPEDDETAEHTGLSMSKVRLARKCSRIAGSLDKEMVEGWRVKFMEVIPDSSIESSDEIVAKQHMRKDIIKLLAELDPRERQVLVLRYGLTDGRCKSLGEIAKTCCVTKEWIKKIERSALAKIRRDDIRRDLKGYLHL